jgi:hypothetical protein
VKPFEEDQPFTELIDYITAQELTGTDSGEVRYGQTRK